MLQREWGTNIPEDQRLTVAAIQALPTYAEECAQARQACDMRPIFALGSISDKRDIPRAWTVPLLGRYRRHLCRRELLAPERIPSERQGRGQRDSHSLELPRMRLQPT